MEYLFLLGRILFGGFFLMSGIGHFKDLENTAAYAASKKVPLPKLAVGFSGLLIVLGGLGVLLGIYAQYALALIIIFLLGVTFKMHAYWSDTDPGMKMGNRINFYKNLALLGAALMMLASPWPYSLIK